jgi:hypothetical protein
MVRKMKNASLTIFSCPKPFIGHIGIIQKNAIKSWICLEPRPEIILLGDEIGTKKICRKLNLKYIPHIKRNEYSTPLLNDIFSKAQKNSKNNMLCYINADIILFQDFIPSLKRVIKWRKNFLMIGRRWDLDVKELLDYNDPKFKEKLISKIKKQGFIHPLPSSDYFVFPKGIFGKLPPFALGRTIYDYWLIWFARNRKIPVIDATKVVTCIHQNHDRTYASIGKKPINKENSFIKSEESKKNLRLVGGNYRRLFNIYDSTHIMTQNFIFPAVCGKYLERRIGKIGESINKKSPQLYKLLKKFKPNIL